MTTAVLTPRETQVLESMASGLKTTAIAHDLSISDRTVEIYRTNILRKMEAANTTHAVAKAFRRGILQ